MSKNLHNPCCLLYSLKTIEMLRCAMENEELSKYFLQTIETTKQGA